MPFGVGITPLASRKRRLSRKAFETSQSPPEQIPSGTECRKRRLSRKAFETRGSEEDREGWGLRSRKRRLSRKAFETAATSLRYKEQNIQVANGDSAERHLRRNTALDGVLQRRRVANGDSAERHLRLSLLSKTSQLTIIKSQTATQPKGI